MVRISFIVSTLVLFVLAGCSQQQATTKSGAFDPYQPLEQAVQTQDAASAQDATRLASPQKIAILLPLSGAHEQIGQSLLNAAQLAVFDMDDPSVELIPLDTKGTTTGTSEAMSQAAANGASLILGPLLAGNVTRAGIIARRYNLNVIGFTTDSSVTGGNVFTVGILPYDQGQRLAQYAAKSGLKRIIAILPNGLYAHEITTAFERKAYEYGLHVVGKISYTEGSSPEALAQTVAERKDEFDAILMPFGNPTLEPVAKALTRHGVGTTTTTWLGAGVWDDPSVKMNSTMIGAYYAAPSPKAREGFEQKYRSIYAENPQRLASLGYDATALGVVLLQQTQGKVDTNAILNPNGFSGVDGVFRFKVNGMTERGLAIHRIEGIQGSIIVDPAPTNFMATNNSTISEVEKAPILDTLF